MKGIVQTLFKCSCAVLFILISFTYLNAQVKTTATVYNPLLPDNIADPSVVSFNGRFYLYGTTDVDQGLDKSGPPVVWQSDDFVNWHFEGLLDFGIDCSKPYTYKDNNGKEKTGYFRYWAPGNVIKKEGLFYLFVTIVKPDGAVGTYLLKSARPEGPFNFTNGKGLYFNEPDKSASETQPLLNDIDGDPFIDDDGQAYVYWRRRKAVALSTDLMSQKGEVITIPTKFGGYSEGPGMFKRKGLYYYFYTLSGNASYSNAYMVSRKTPMGPFEQPAGPNVFIYSNTVDNIWGPGHGNVFHLPGTDRYFFVYLEFGEGGTTRQVYVNEIFFNADGTIKPISPNHLGVGALKKLKNRSGENIAPRAIITASSVQKEKIVQGKIKANEDDLLKNRTLPEKKAERLTSYLAQHAADRDNGSRWRAAAGDTAPWISFDLGIVTIIKSCEMSFVFPAYGHAWLLEKSADGRKWERYAQQKDLAIRSPHVAKAIGKARYLRLKITKGEPGLWEMKIFN